MGNVINELAESGIVKGVATSVFEPDSGITNAQFLTMVLRTAGIGEKQYRGGLNDVSTEDWFAPSVQAALDYGLLGRMIVDGGFKPNERIMREDMSYLAVKAYELKKGEKADEKEISFADSGSISAEKREYVKKAFGLNLIDGYPDGLFMPLNGASRAEAVKIIKVLTDTIK